MLNSLSGRSINQKFLEETQHSSKATQCRICTEKIYDKRFCYGRWWLRQGKNGFGTDYFCESVKNAINP